ILFLSSAILLFMFFSCQENSQTSVERAAFGTTTKGDSVYRYTLEQKNGVEVSILNYGGIMQAMKTPDKEGKTADIALGFSNIEKYQELSPYFGALIGRYGNRIADGTFTLNDSTYHLYINDGPNSLHGGKEGFDKKIWD